MKIIGHRGAKGLAPENTIASLRKALEHQVDEIEFDVRVTKDQVPILLHDPELVDAAGNRLLIREQSYASLKAHKADLTTLAEALDLVKAQVPLYVEVKPHELVKPVIDVLRSNPAYGAENLLLASKNQKTLRELHRAMPDIPVVVIEPWSGVRAHWRARQVNTTLISMNQRWLWRGFISSVSRRGWQLYAYTLNDPVKAKRWAKYGLYGVITDCPDRFEK